MKRDRFRDTVIAGVIAGVIIACGNGAAELIGEAIKDGGEALSDAGQMLKDAGQRLREDSGELIEDAGDALEDAGARILSDASDVLEDAGDALQDAGGQLLSDAGEVLQDAGETTMDAGDAMLQDADAQSSCGNCNDDGFQRVLTADTDWDQIRGGSVQGTGWTRLYNTNDYGMAYYFYTELVNGPFILTDVHGSAGTTTLFAVDDGNDCFEEYTHVGMGYTGIAWRIPTDSRPIAVASTEGRLQGARIVIQTDETLCARATSNADVANDPDITTANKVLWSGFRPYQ